MALAAAMLLLAGPSFAQAPTGKTVEDKAAPSPISISRQGNFFVGGESAEDGSVLASMYVQYQVPAEQKHPYPLIFIHGGGQTGVAWNETPDGREGWAQYFLRQGYAVYVVDEPARGRSPYRAELGSIGQPFTSEFVQAMFTNTAAFDRWPAADLQKRWPDSGAPGSETLKQVMASQVGSLPLAVQETLSAQALVALVDKIGPSILVQHSASGPASFRVADARPNKVKALVALEPVYTTAVTVFPGTPDSQPAPFGLTRAGGISYDPPVKKAGDLKFVKADVIDPYVSKCWQQSEPVRKFKRLNRTPILLLTAEASFNTLWDPCTANFLRQGGADKLTWMRLEDKGVRRNGHFMFVEQNSDRIAGLVQDWIEGPTGAGR